MEAIAVGQLLFILLADLAELVLLVLERDRSRRRKGGK